MAFLFTVLGEWYVERKVIGRGTFSCSGVEFKTMTDGYGRYLDWDGVVFMWDCAMCTEQNMIDNHVLGIWLKA